jgi:hypothetical protein
MTGLITGRPLVVLREDRGGPKTERVDRIRAYLKARSARRFREYERWRKQQEREAAKLRSCVYCGRQTNPWERGGGVAICTSHTKSMSGRYPFRLGVLRADLDQPVKEAMYAARKALYVFEKRVRQEEIHGRQAR